MKEKTYKIDGLDGHKIFVASWMPENNNELKGIIQIVHGMAEYCLRYRHLADYLTSKGYGVYAHDHRGHGQSLDNENDLGFFHESNGWDIVIDEVHIVTEFIKKENLNSDIFIFGHSMGSIVTRGYIQKYGDDVKCAIISGTSATKGVLGYAGIGLAKLICLLRGKRHRGKLLTNLSFGSFNKKFKPTETDNDWLSRDREQVAIYNQDDKCGFLCSAGFYVDLLRGLNKVSKKSNITKTPKSLPIYFISGDNDPVGDMGKGIRKICGLYSDLGYNVKIKLYEGSRHEIINEINKDEVYEDIFNYVSGL
jgi:alpha-beta hydrolase superfamily lysophospholipase